jgi:hypothetical protein
MVIYNFKQLRYKNITANTATDPSNFTIVIEINSTAANEVHFDRTSRLLDCSLACHYH